MSEPLQTSRLQEVTAEIITLTQQGQKVALSYAIEIGRRLTIAKGLVEHGEWGAYLKENIRYSERTAQNFMRLFDQYGADQTDLFGTIKAKSLADLTYTQALALLAVPEEEREELAGEIKEKGYSNRELEEAIRERNEAREALEKEKQKHSDELAEQAERSREANEALARNAERLRKELAELKSRPVEVAVQDASAEQLRAARDEEQKKAKDAEEKLKKELAEAEEKLMKAEKERKKAEEERESTKAALEDAEKKLKDTDPQETERLRKAVAMADPVVLEFKVLFSEVQDKLVRLKGLAKSAGEDTREKLLKALEALRGAI